MKKKIQIPKWCMFPNATDFWDGCWSLFYGFVKNKEFCKDCEYCEVNKNGIENG